MSKRYCCAKCGAELNENEYLVNISPMGFTGMDTDPTVQLPIYATETELKELIERGKAGNGIIELTMEEMLQFAYNGVNRLHPDEKKEVSEEVKKKCVEDGLAVFEKGLMQHAENLKAWEEKVAKANEKEKERLLGQKAKSERSGRGTLNFIHTQNHSKSEPNNDDETDISEEAKQNFLSKITTSIPGLTWQMSAQMYNNFFSGCVRFTMEEDREYGIHFENLSYTGEKKKGSSDGRHCIHCKGKILEGAFEKDQYLVGVVGFQKVGKSCLIASMCNALLNGKSNLAMPKKAWEEQYKEELTKYRKGYAVNKTEETGTNTYNPSVVKDDVIWTFIDVPGEAINDPATGEFNINAVHNLFQSVLRCDAYIFCANLQTVKEESDFGEMITVFRSLLRNLENKNQPVLFAMTQKDERITDDNRGEKLSESGPLANCQHSEYLYYKETKFVRNSDPGMVGILDLLAENCYLSVLSCSAYGFQPKKLEESDDSEEREPQPKNIDAIIEWIEQLYGRRAVRARGGREGDAIQMDGHALHRRHEDGSWEVHKGKEESKYIARMFVNPNDLDKMCLDTQDGSFTGKCIQTLLNAGIDPVKLKELLDILKGKRKAS